MADFLIAPDAFGDPFELSKLNLPRPPSGYVVQRLDTDELLDRYLSEFFAIRSPQLDCLFETFDDAYVAASHWVKANCAQVDDHRLAIVPAGYDPKLERPFLIYGVLCSHP